MNTVYILGTIIIIFLSFFLFSGEGVEQIAEVGEISLPQQEIETLLSQFSLVK